MPSTLKGLHRFRNPSQIFCFPCDCAKTGLKGRHRTAWGNALGMSLLIVSPPGPIPGGISGLFQGNFSADIKTH